MAALPDAVEDLSAPAPEGDVATGGLGTPGIEKDRDVVMGGVGEAKKDGAGSGGGGGGKKKKKGKK